VAFVKVKNICNRMAYNRRNILTKIIKIQEITLQLKQTGATQTWIYYNHIKTDFRISKRTYDSYLQTNAKAELKKLLQTQN
jgi:hypothetical protein